MGTNVFANGRGISSKASINKSMAAMPDVCLSPPSPPAGPIPIPYPNFSQASKTDSGSKKVLIKNKEVGLKNKSNYKKSNGDEAATSNFGMGIITHSKQGKTQHAAWSFNVKFEKQNVIRHLDLTTHNHSSNPPNLAVTVDVGPMSPGGPTEEDCAELNNKNNEQRENFKKDEVSKRPKKDSDRKTVQALGEESTTITHAKYKPPDGPTFGLKASSRALADTYDNGFVEGLPKEKAKKGETELCDKATKERNFQYRQTDRRPHTSHTESRIIEEIMAATKDLDDKGTLLMSINWKQGEFPDGSDMIDDSPCEHCQRLICAAQECGLKIKLCQGEPTPKPEDPPPCDEDLS